MDIEDVSNVLTFFDENKKNKSYAFLGHLPFKIFLLSDAVVVVAFSVGFNCCLYGMLV